MLEINDAKYKLLDYIKISEDAIYKYENITSAGVIVECDNKYLFGFNDWRLQWEIACGGIEKDELPIEAAKRELYEEMHQKINDIEFKGLVKKERPNGTIVYSAIYYCNVNKIEQFIKQENDENEKIILWDLKENIGNVDKIDKKIVEIICEL